MNSLLEKMLDKSTEEPPGVSIGKNAEEINSRFFGGTPL